MFNHQMLWNVKQQPLHLRAKNDNLEMGVAMGNAVGLERLPSV